MTTTFADALPERQGPTRGLMIYLTVGFVGAWAVWIVCGLMSRHGTQGEALVPFAIAGSFAPFLASGLAVYNEGGAGAALRFYRRGLQWRMGWSAFVVSVFGLPLLAVTVAAAFGSLRFQMGWQEVPFAYVWLLVLGGPLAEEFGWSYLSDRLDKRFALFSSNLLLGVIWGFWHLPLFFLTVPGLSQSFIPFPVFLIMTVAIRFLMAWCYYRGGRNILSNLLAHNGGNFVVSLVPTVIFVHGSPQWRLVAFSALTAVSAAVLFRVAPVTTAAGAPSPPPKMSAG